MPRPARMIFQCVTVMCLAVAAGAIGLPGCSSATSKAITLTTDNFDEIVLRSKQPVLVDFWAEWCGPCKMMDPVIRELAAELEGRAKVGKVNIDDFPNIREKYEVEAFPTFLIFKDGKVVQRVRGARPKFYLGDLLAAEM